MATKHENSTHVRLSDEADAMAQLLAEAKGVEKSRLLGNLLERVLLGEGHALKVAAMRLAKVGFAGIDRSSE